MKNFLFFLLTIFVLAACNNEATEETEVEDVDTIATIESSEEELPSTGSYGAEITADNAVPVASLSQSMVGKDSMDIKVQGEIEEVCQKKGCWMTMQLANGDKMRIVFKDYEFFVPKDASGKQAVLQGTAKRKTTSVEDLKHYAEDEGKSAEEIAAITQPKEEIEFVAEGVIIR